MQAAGVGLAIVHVHHRRRGHRCVGQTLTAAVVHTKLGPSTIRRDAGCRAKGGLMAVDSLDRYTDPSGKVSVVASCDIYDFADGLVTEIVSYTVEVFE